VPPTPRLRDLARFKNRPGAGSRDLSIMWALNRSRLAPSIGYRGHLDEAGLIRRVRSEGDCRRSYVQLAQDDPMVAALVSGHPATPPADERVVFVCTHNSARSQFAAAAWARASTVPATSAGTHPADRVHPHAIRVGRRHGLALAGSSTAHVADVVRSGDLVVAVCDNAHEGAAGPAEAALVPARPIFGRHGRRLRGRLRGHHRTRRPPRPCLRPHTAP
jgi:hypothetical protein